MPHPTRRSIHLVCHCAIGAVLFACQLPPRTLDWEIANQTADTLVVTTRYALDSTVVTPADITAMGRHASGNLTFPLNRLVRYQKSWYHVHNTNDDGILVIMYNKVNHTRRGAQVDTVHGRITYSIPPGETHSLAAAGYDGSEWEEGGHLTLPFAELWVRQGRVRRALSADDFQKLQPDNEHRIARSTIGIGLLSLR